MDGLRVVAGVGVDIEIDGEKYRLGALTLDDHAEAEAYLLSFKKDPLEAIRLSLAKLPPAMQQKAIDSAVKQAASGWQRVTASEMDEWVNSLDGKAWLFWKCLQKHHEEIDTFEKGRALFRKLLDATTLKAVELAMDRASGLPQSKNSDGQAHQESVPAASPGPASIAS